MSGELTAALNFVRSHWGWIATSGIGVYAAKLIVERLRADQHTCCEVFDQLGLLADSIEGIIGTQASLPADCDRCRKASTHRRRAGETIQEAFPRERFIGFRQRLTAIDKATRILEDSVHAQNASATATVSARQEACIAIEELRREFVRRTRSRISLKLFGRRRGTGTTE